MEFNDRRPDRSHVMKRDHLFRDIEDPTDLADHMTYAHGVDPDQEGWPRDTLRGIHRGMHS